MIGYLSEWSWGSLQWVERVWITESGNWDPDPHWAPTSLSDPRWVSSLLCPGFLPYETSPSDVAHFLTPCFHSPEPGIHREKLFTQLYPFENKERDHNAEVLFISRVKRPLQMGNDSPRIPPFDLQCVLSSSLCARDNKRNSTLGEAIV